MGRHSGSHHSSSRSHRGSHHSSSRSHSGGHHRSGGGSGGSGHTYSSVRTSKYRYRSGSSRYYSDDDIPVSAVQYNGSWYRENGSVTTYGLNLDDEYVKANYDKSKTSLFFRLTKKSPAFWILGFYALFFCIPIVFGIAGSNIFYELVIPVFENADMTDAAFYIADEALYCFQYIAAMALIIGIPVATIKKYKRSREYEISFTKEVLAHYNQLEAESRIKYLDVCSFCGAPAGMRNGEPIKYCEYCGRSLIKNEDED